MKKVCLPIIMTVLFMIFSCSAMCENDSLPHQLWGLSYNHNAKVVQSLVKEARNIICDYTYYPKSKLLPAYGKIKSTNDDQIFLYGYPFHFEYCDNPSYFKLQLHPSGSLDDRVRALETISNGLIEKYGVPDHALIEYYSHGLDSWIFHEDVAVHEIEALDAAEYQNTDIIEKIFSWPYYQQETEVTVYLYFFNIAFSSRLYKADSEKSFIEITFYASSTLPKDPLFEECLSPEPTKEPVNQDGF